MATPYFQEVQRLRDNRWILLLIFGIALGAMLPLIYGLYWQVVKGVQWGNEPMKDSELIVMTIFVFTALIIMVFVMMSLRLEVFIDDEGVHYRMVPVKGKWRIVTPSQISSYTFADRYKLFESGGIGHHRNILKNTRSFRIFGGKHMTLTLNDGHRLLLGTQDRGGMEWAMRKLMKTN